ncbi:hypothetical protein D3C72_2406710 [compost metagenome]
MQIAFEAADVVGQGLQLSVGELLGHAAHDGVTTAHIGVLLDLVGLEGHEEVVGMLAGDLGVRGINGLGEVVAMA